MIREEYNVFNVLSDSGAVEAWRRSHWKITL